MAYRIQDNMVYNMALLHSQCQMPKLQGLGPTKATKKRSQPLDAGCSAFNIRAGGHTMLEIS